MKALSLTLAFSFCLGVLAHDEGHGPQVKEAGQYGGILASVILEKDLKSRGAVTVRYKAELIRAQDGTLALYFYDLQMKPATLDAFAVSMPVKMEVKRAGKFTYVGEFKLERNGQRYSGKLPAVRQRPFNLDVFPTVNQEKLFVGFSNLD